VNPDVGLDLKLKEAMLSTSLQYQGNGQAELGQSAIQATGPTVVTVDERGTVSAVMQVTNFPTSASREEGVFQLLRESFSSIGQTPPCSLQVIGSNGVFTSGKHTFPNAHLNLEEHTASIEFQCFRGEYIENESEPKYWRLPILNFHGGLSPVHRLPPGEHVMRLSYDNPISMFEMFGEAGFVEYIPGFKELVAKHKNGDRTPLITAAIVGSTNGRGTDWQELKTWFPFDFLNLLSFASGSRVGAPWIEFADEHGRLIRRTHVQLGTTLLQHGEGFLNDVIHRGGLGLLLTCASRSAEFKKSYFRVAMNHLLLGIRDSQSLEDKISHLSRALEGLATEFGFDQQYLLETADDEVKKNVKDVLKNAGSDIVKLANEQEALGRVSVAASLRKVAERTVSNPANVDRDFGLSVLALLNHFGLHDSGVVETYYAETPRSDGRRWHQVLSHYRGLTQHGDAFRFDEGEHSASEVYRLALHLADIVARILLIQLGYQGEYQRATAKWVDAKTTGWVEPNTPPIELRYGDEAEQHDEPA
jgi:hypothetical protein